MTPRSTPEPPPRFVVGIDENGLGPRLGPMTVTAVLLALTVDDLPYRQRCALAGIGDSKGLCAHGAMSEVESFVLSVLEVHLGLRPPSLDALLDALALHDLAARRALCPDRGDAPSACFDAAVNLPAFGPGITDTSRSRAEELLRGGVALGSARVALPCPRALNSSRAAGRSRFDVDLDLMIDLALALHRSLAPGTTVDVACGKVGGRRAYAAALTRAVPLIDTITETAARSEYRLPGVGRIAFVRDGDATEPAISLASLVGKYLRELSMERLYRYYSGRLPGLARASGYHDPVTARFIEATALVRQQRAIPEDCFER